MTYDEIIQRNIQEIAPSWWTRYAFHYTDVTNAVGILSSGKVYSRNQAKEKHLMVNDNASRQVIDRTYGNVTDCARFYFRPLTPTQFRNEGYKHPQLRFVGDPNANVPVPVFLVFSLAKVLSDPRARFSAQTQAGFGSDLLSGPDCFAKLPFKKIYSDGASTEDVFKFRHAEILIPNCYDVEDSLLYILCRNDCEKNTLLNLLQDHDLKAYYRYRDRVRVVKKETFQRNGLFIEKTVYHDRTLCFGFACTPEKKDYERRAINELGGTIEPLAPVSVRIDISWLNNKGEVLHSDVYTAKTNYLAPQPIGLSNMPEIPGANTIAVRVYLDDKLTCYFRQSLSTYEVM